MTAIDKFWMWLSQLCYYNYNNIVMLSLHEFVGGDVLTIQGQGHPIQGQIRQKIYKKLSYSTYLSQTYTSPEFGRVLFWHINTILIWTPNISVRSLVGLENSKWPPKWPPSRNENFTTFPIKVRNNDIIPSFFASRIRWGKCSTTQG